jgi:hypothetical protein
MFARAAKDGDRGIGAHPLVIHHPGGRVLSSRIELVRVLPRVGADIRGSFPCEDLTNGCGDRI